MQKHIKTWCDQLGSTPTAGVRLDTHFATSEQLLSALAPVLNKATRNRKPNFNLELTNQFETGVSTFEGFHYTADRNKVAVSFRHRMSARRGKDGTPVTEITSLSKPFSDLLDITIDKNIEAVELVHATKARTFDRVGIVSTTLVDPDNAPPGIHNFIRYLSRPWNGGVEFYNMSITADLESTSLYSDRCTHTLARVEDQEQDTLTIVLDYQRRFGRMRPVAKGTLTKSFDDMKVAAISYFEQVGIGAKFDERLIGGAIAGRPMADQRPAAS